MLTKFIRKFIRPTTQRANSERGQSLVEFAFMVIVISFLLLGTLDLGRAYFTYMALQDAAVEGATYASVNPTKWCGPSNSYFAACPTDKVSADPDNVVFRVVNSATSGVLVDWTQTTVTVDGGTVKPGQTISVTLTTQYRLLTPFVSTIVGNSSMALKAQAQAVILSTP